MSAWLAACGLIAAALASAQVFLDEKKASEMVLRGCDSIAREEKVI